MTRAALVLVVLVSLAAGACGEGAAVGESPTGPTGTPAAQTPAGGGCTMPGAPSNLNVSVVGTTTVQMTWSAGSGATEY